MLKLYFYLPDFDMSDAQQEHALAVERLAPRLAALRIELCPSHMSEGCFWKIYFVLLHSRLSKHDAELLLTPQALFDEPFAQTAISGCNKMAFANNQDITCDENLGIIKYQLVSKVWERGSLQMKPCMAKYVTRSVLTFSHLVGFIWELYGRIVEARAMWLQELQNRTKQESDRFRRGISFAKDATTTDSEDRLSTVSGVSEVTTLTTFAFEPTSSIPAADFETEKHPIVTSETRMIDKSVVEEGPPIQIKSDVILSSASKPFSYEYEDDEDDWLAEEHDEIGAAAIPFGNEEDVSFSDLEDDYDGTAPMSSKTPPDTSGVSLSGSRGWVQLDKNSGDAAKGASSAGTGLCQAGQLNASRKTKSSDWLDVEEDIDVVRH
ncbi:hypothetical protein ACLOJK_036045 [Asimina triloba]